MAGSIYDKPTRGLFKEMLADWAVQPGQVFTTERVLHWFQERYPKLRPGTIKAHLVVFSTNDKSRLHHTFRPGDDMLVKLATNQYRLYEAGKDPAPIREMVPGDVARQDAADEQDSEEALEAPLPGSTQFALEQDLQRYLADNLRIIEPGLTLYQDEGLKGLEYPAGGGRRIDILALDKAGGFVVLELKVEKGYDRVVGQLLRYMNWVRKELAEPGQRVRGIIVCRAMSEDLRLACASIKDVALFEYQLSVTVTEVPALDLPS